MIKFTNPFKLQATGVTKAWLSSGQRTFPSSPTEIQLAIEDKGDHAILTAPTDPARGVWHLHIRAQCGCWKELVFTDCTPVPQIGSGSANTTTPNAATHTSTASPTPIPSCTPLL